MDATVYIRDGILKPLKILLDQFVAEGVLISDSSCDFVVPLVIVNKKDSRIRMAVGYREVNMLLEAKANQLPYQPTLFQRLGGNDFMLKWTIAPHGRQFRGHRNHNSMGSV